MREVSELALILLLPVIVWGAFLLRALLKITQQHNKLFNLKFLSVDTRLDGHEKLIANHEIRIKGLENERTAH